MSITIKDQITDFCLLDCSHKQLEISKNLVTCIHENVCKEWNDKNKKPIKCINCNDTGLVEDKSLCRISTYSLIKCPICNK